MKINNQRKQEDLKDSIRKHYSSSEIWEKAYESLETQDEEDDYS
jgi:hypothetical protein